MALYRLVASSPPLDNNSSYCNLLQCSHFSKTSVAAESDSGDLMGFISGYRIPSRNETLFIWQVAVAEEARGKGLASSMLSHILNRHDNANVSFIETTITEDNKASWALFNRLSKTLNAQLNANEWLDANKHFDNEHESESLVRIGPLKTNLSENL